MPLYGFLKFRLQMDIDMYNLYLLLPLKIISHLTINKYLISFKITLLYFSYYLLENEIQEYTTDLEFNYFKFRSKSFISLIAVIK